jgi:toxin ParE1/3/4
MDNYKIRITEPAFQDMKAVKLYIRDELFNPEAADKLINDFYSAMQSLDKMPKRHKIIENELISVTLGIRRVPVSNYDVFYRCSEDERVVTITRVLYSKREWKDLFISE